MYILFLFLFSIQNDTSFEYSVEQFVIANSTRSIPTPIHIKECIDLMSSEDYRARSVATKELFGYGRKIHRYLYWQVNHPDLEVRWRIRKIIKGFNICLNCSGEGVCSVFKGVGDKSCLVCSKSWYGHGPNSSIDCPSCENGYVINFDIEKINELYK